MINSSGDGMLLEVWVVQADTQSGTRCGLTLDWVG